MWVSVPTRHSCSRTVHCSRVCRVHQFLLSQTRRFAMGSSQPKGWGKGKGKVPEVPQVSVRGWRQGAPQHVRQPETVRSCRSPGDVRVGLPARSPGCSQLWRFWRRTIREERVGGFAQESASTSRDSTSEQIEHTQQFIESAKKRVVLGKEYVQWAQDWIECEKELSENVWRDCAWRPSGRSRPHLPKPDLAILI